MGSHGGSVSLYLFDLTVRAVNRLRVVKVLASTAWSSLPLGRAAHEVGSVHAQHCAAA